MHTTPPQGRRELAGVQVLRAVAALGVLLSHLPWYLESQLGITVPHVDTGQPSVAVFFTISGLVAVLISSRRPAPRPGDFLRRRLVRIVPLAWAFTTIQFVADLIRADPGATLRPMHVALSYLFIPSRGPDGVVEPLYLVCWTLSLELAFYALVTAALARRLDPLVVAGPVLTVLALASLLRGDDWPAWAFYADDRVLFFVVGMIVGRWWTRRDLLVPFVAMTLLWSIWGLIVLASGATTAQLLLLPASTLVLVAVLSAEDRLLSRTPRWLVTLGHASYALYLSHPVVAPLTLAGLAACGASRHGDAWWWGTAAVAVCLGASVLIWHGVDRPLTVRLARATRPRPQGDAPSH